MHPKGGGGGSCPDKDKSKIARVDGPPNSPCLLKKTLHYIFDPLRLFLGAARTWLFNTRSRAKRSSAVAAPAGVQSCHSHRNVVPTRALPAAVAVTVSTTTATPKVRHDSNPPADEGPGPTAECQGRQGTTRRGVAIDTGGCDPRACGPVTPSPLS